MEEKTHRGESSAKVEAETEAMQPQAGEAGNQQKHGTGTEQILPKSLQRKRGLADTLILDLWLLE